MALIENTDTKMKGWENGMSEFINVTREVDEDNNVYLTRSGKNLSQSPSELFLDNLFNL